MLPDLMVVAGVLGEFSDSLSKQGTQVGFRLASKMHMDSRPSLDHVKTFAEYLLAEAEDLTVNVVGNAGNGGAAEPIVKSLSLELESGKVTQGEYSI